MNRFWGEWRGFFAFIAVMLVLRSAIADWNQVPSGSMLPAILVGDRIIVHKIAYDLRLPFTLWRLARWGDPERGDVVTFISPEDERLLVKRVIALPGDWVSMTDNRLVLNDTPAHYQPSLIAADAGLGPNDWRGHRLVTEVIMDAERQILLREAGGDGFTSSFPPIRVPDGHYLMLGDNRDNSRDSRAIGFIARDRIIGKATAVAFSLDYDNHYAPRLDRFFADLP